MKNGVHFFRDHDDCSPRIQARGGPRLVYTFLQTDIQDAALAGELLGRLEEVAAGERDRYEMTGNGHHLEADNRSVRIESLFDDSSPAQDMELAPFVALVASWQRFLADSSLLAAVHRYPEHPAAG